MQEKKSVLVAMVKCGKVHRTYGIRLEKNGNNDYVGTWAFPIKETAAKHEGYDKTVIRGGIRFANDYPGCPYCETSNLVVCDCGHLGCLILKDGKYRCEWCGTIGTLTDYTGQEISAGMDR